MYDANSNVTTTARKNHKVRNDHTTSTIAIVHRIKMTWMMILGNLRTPQQKISTSRMQQYLILLLKITDPARMVLKIGKNFVFINFLTIYPAHSVHRMNKYRQQLRKKKIIIHKSKKKDKSCIDLNRLKLCVLYYIIDYI